MDFKNQYAMKNFRYLLQISVFLILFSSCGENGDCDCDDPLQLRPIQANEEQIIESANYFAFDLFSKINETESNKNIFLSPLSISTALSMAANGAEGETKDGIKDAIHLGNVTDDEINESYYSLVPFLKNLDPKVTTNLANSIWYKDDYHIKPEFRDILLEYYNAEVNPASFNDPATKDLINGWIEDKTNGKIKNMIDQISADIVMYLINAIYFKATWQYQFDKAKTQKMIFNLADGSVTSADMMQSNGVSVSYYRNQDLQFIEIPYGNGQFVFSILLPNNTQDLNETIGAMNTTKFNSLVDGADSITVQLFLPKFKIEYKVLLNEVLSAMGMAQSFGADADFSNLFTEELDLAISRVLHQSFIELDEEGTEAAAATVIEIGVTSAGPGTKPNVIYVDKPFAFFIREKHSKSILFAGKLLDPTK